MINNKAKFSRHILSELFGNDNIINIEDDYLNNSVVIDSRIIQKGDLFVPLLGANIDGHTKILEAFDNGASASLINKSYYIDNKDALEGKALIITDDTFSALALLASEHRRNFNIPIVAIAGSNGKTTTKEMLAQILSKKFNVLKTFANYNNQLGVPLMMLALDEDHDMAVFEIATNEPGEISTLCKILNPNYGVVTNIGKEHLEKLLDLDGVEMEETFLFGHLRRQNGLAFINMFDDRLIKYASILEKKVLYGPQEGIMVQAEIIQGDKGIDNIINMRFKDDTKLKINLKSGGKPNALNAITAMTIAKEFDINNDSIKEAIEGFKDEIGESYGRMKYESIKGLNIINDTYNANPSSVMVALQVLASTSSDNKIAVLGDMLELGDTAKKEHKAIIEKAKLKANKIFLYGQNFQSLKDEYTDDNSISFSMDKNEIANALKEYQSATILLKGSRGMKMEDVIEELKK